jgi:outer membrane protein OmpA-like peptidoglycan-associated protein
VKIVLEDIHFDFDKATLTKAAREILARDIATLKENQGVNVQIEGHTCAHGTEDYNMALGERRANAVKEYLVNEGISADRVTTISYGETRLAMPEIPHLKQGVKGSKANRRVHFESSVR